MTAWVRMYTVAVQLTTTMCVLSTRGERRDKDWPTAATSKADVEKVCDVERKFDAHVAEDQLRVETKPGTEHTAHSKAAHDNVRPVRTRPNTCTVR